MVNPVRVALVLLLIPPPQISSVPELTSGSVALLVTRTDADAKSQLRQALRHTDPAIRRTAARVIAATPHLDLKNELFAALARERDNAAAAEFVRDLLLVGGSAAVPAVEPQVRRIGEPAALAYAEWLGRADAERFIEKLPSLNDLVVDSAASLAGIVAMVGDQHADARARVHRAWMAVAPEGLWQSLLDRAYAPPLSAKDASDVLLAALQSDRAHVRAETIWYLVGQLGMGRSVPDHVLKAVTPAPPDALMDWETFGREVVARDFRKVATPDRSKFLETIALEQRGDATLLLGLFGTTDEERRVLKGFSVTRDESRLRGGPMRTISASPIVPGGLHSLLEAAGCKETTDDSVGVITIEYAPHGSPKRITLDPQGLSADCRTAVANLGRLSVAEPDAAVTDDTQTIVVPLNSAAVACADTAPDPPIAEDLKSMLRRGQATVWQPLKLRDVKPRYPADAERRSIQGVVVIESVIDRTGCVRRARVIRSVYSSLDIAAIRAVTAWTFEPTLLERTPISVRMTATVNFTLR
jgi:protein TonB